MTDRELLREIKIQVDRACNVYSTSGDEKLVEHVEGQCVMVIQQLMQARVVEILQELHGRKP
jgi:hypothetical protein